MSETEVESEREKERGKGGKWRKDVVCSALVLEDGASLKRGLPRSSIRGYLPVTTLCWMSTICLGWSAQLRTGTL